MTDDHAPTRNHSGADPETVARELAEALAVRAARLRLDPQSVTSPSPRAVIARTHDGGLVRVDVCSYRCAELDR